MQAKKVLKKGRTHDYNGGKCITENTYDTSECINLKRAAFLVGKAAITALPYFKDIYGAAALLTATVAAQLWNYSSGSNDLNNPDWGKLTSKSTTRSPSRPINDSDSSSFYTQDGNDDDDSGDDNTDKGPKSREDFMRRIRKISKHLIQRLTRWFRFGGILQRISEETGASNPRNLISRNNLLRMGASQYQDQTSGRGRDIHAGHVVRAGAINPDLRRLLPASYIELQNFLGHTQNVPKEANTWHRVGGDIDRFQENNTSILNGINFNGPLTPRVRETISGLVREYIVTLLADFEAREDLRNEILEATLVIDSMPVEMLFDFGRRGYTGENMSRYRQ